MEPSEYQRLSRSTAHYSRAEPHRFGFVGQEVTNRPVSYPNLKFRLIV